jgi:hypothetical protein
MYILVGPTHVISSIFLPKRNNKQGDTEALVPAPPPPVYALAPPPSSLLAGA